MIEIEISNRQTRTPLQMDRLVEAVRMVLADNGFERGSVSVAVVDDAQIQQLNCQYLQHDYATDVLSFVLESGTRSLQGQIVVSADTAERAAPQYGWSTDDELLLYVIHGALHLVGYDDTTEEASRRMRSGERFYLERIGIESPAGDESPARDGPAGPQLQGGGA